MVDSSLALPLYHQVASILRQRVEDGIYAVGERLLSEDELAAEFNVSRATIRQAMGELAIEGLVVRKQGRGTFVAAPDSKVIQQRFRGSLGDLIGQSKRARMTNIRVEHGVDFSDQIVNALEIDGPSGSVIRRTRTMDGEPFAYTINYLPPDIGALISERALRRSALLDLLMKHGIRYGSATQSIRAQLADIDVCKWMDVELGSAVLYVERLVQDTTGKPIEFVRSWYRGDRYEYTVTLDMEGEGDVYSHLA